jgi:hypothetical protein
MGRSWITHLCSPLSHLFTHIDCSGLSTPLLRPLHDLWTTSFLNCARFSPSLHHSPSPLSLTRISCRTSPISSFDSRYLWSMCVMPRPLPPLSFLFSLVLSSLTSYGLCHHSLSSFSNIISSPFILPYKLLARGLHIKPNILATTAWITGE